MRFHLRSKEHSKRRQGLRDSVRKLRLERLESRVVLSSGAMCGGLDAEECPGVEPLSSTALFGAATLSLPGVDTSDLGAVDSTASPRGHHNDAKPTDVNGDGVVTTLDALLLFDKLNLRDDGAGAPGGSSQGAGEAADNPVGSTAVHWDVHEDGHLTPRDVLLVIDELNRQAVAPALEVTIPAARPLPQPVTNVPSPDAVQVQTTTNDGGMSVQLPSFVSLGNWGRDTQEGNTFFVDVPRWMPFVPTDADIRIVAAHQPTKAHVTLTFLHTGHRVIDWGHVTRQDKTFIVAPHIEVFSGVVGNAATHASHDYELGNLQPGDYTFQCMAHGQLVQLVRFTVADSASLG